MTDDVTGRPSLASRGKSIVALRLRRAAHRLAPIKGTTWTGEWNPAATNVDDRLTIRTNGAAVDTSVTVGGKPIGNCSGIRLEVTAGGLWHGTLEFDYLPLEFDGEVRFGTLTFEEKGGE